MSQQTSKSRIAPTVLVAVVATVLALVAAGWQPAQAAPKGTVQPAKAAAAWSPYLGVTFNNPNGTSEQQARIVRRVNEAIDHTPAGETIRIATYNLAVTATADKLLAAHKRGVKVQVIVNSNLLGNLERRMQGRLGTNPYKSSFLVYCKNACRNGSAYGNMHLKISSFTRTGTAKRLFISSSSNLGGAAMYGQWNDSVAIAGDVGLFSAWWNLFDELRKDQTASPRRVTYVGDKIKAFYQRPVAGSTTTTENRVATTRAAVGDAPYVRLSKVSCNAPAGFGNSSGKTVITVNMRAWYAARGERLAKLLALRKSYGCQVRVIGSLMSKEVVRILTNARIPVKAADWDWGPRPSTSDADVEVYGPSCYSHLKYVTVSGAYNGHGDRLVWTGSENWSPPGLSSDEVTLEIHDAKTVKAYNDQFTAMWNSARVTHRVGIEPKYRPCARA